MKVFYDSMTGNVERFARQLSGFEIEKINTDSLAVEPYILITHTIRLGEVPSLTQSFLHKNSHFLRGVASSGNVVWGHNYGAAAHKISLRYGVPIILIFELSGTKQDVIDFTERVKMLDHS